MVSEEELVELSFPQYWDERYKAEQHGKGELESFEWYRDFQKLQPFLDSHLPPSQSGSDCHILHLGCGNSVFAPSFCPFWHLLGLQLLLTSVKAITNGYLKTLTADLYHRGYTNQTSVDFSEVVIDAMKSKYAKLNTQWLLMDLRELDLPDASVDVAIDKATLDAFMHGSLWDPPDDVRTNVGKYVDEVARVLKPGGSWLYITYRQPHFVKPLLIREKQWNLSVEVLQDLDGAGGFDYFGFVMRKRHEGEEKSDSGPEGSGSNKA